MRGEHITGIYTILAAIIGVIGGTAATKLADTYFFIPNNYISNEDYEILQQAYNELDKKYKSTSNEINNLQNEIIDLENKNDILNARISGFIKVDPDDTSYLNTNEKISYTLEELYLIDSDSYEVAVNFEDSYGDIHPIAYKFISSYNAYAVFNLNGQYNKFSAKIVAAPNTGNGANMTLNLILDKKENGTGINAGTYSGITKLTHLQEINEIDLSGRSTLTIETSNQGAFYYGDFYLVDVVIQ